MKKGAHKKNMDELPVHFASTQTLTSNKLDFFIRKMFNINCKHVLDVLRDFSRFFLLLEKAVMSAFFIKIIMKKSISRKFSMLNKRNLRRDFFAKNVFLLNIANNVGMTQFVVYTFQAFFTLNTDKHGGSKRRKKLIFFIDVVISRD